MVISTRSTTKSSGSDVASIVNPNNTTTSLEKENTTKSSSTQKKRQWKKTKQQLKKRKSNNPKYTMITRSKRSTISTPERPLLQSPEKESVNKSRRRIISKVKDRSFLRRNNSFLDELEDSSEESCTSPSLNANDIDNDNQNIEVQPSSTVTQQVSTSSSSSTTIESSNVFTFPPNAIILPRKNNISILKDKKYICTEQNAGRYVKIVNTDVCIDYYHATNGKKFVLDFLETNFEEYTVFEYQQDNDMYIPISESRLNEVVLKRLKNLVSKVGAKNMPKLKKVSGKKAVIRKKKDCIVQQQRC